MRAGRGASGFLPTCAGDGSVDDRDAPMRATATETVKVVMCDLLSYRNESAAVLSNIGPL